MVQNILLGLLMAINCSGCRAYCCRMIGKIIPELDRGDCACIHLTSENRCDIYENRPFICNTDKIYEKYFKDRYTIDQWNDMNHKACEELKNAARL